MMYVRSYAIVHVKRAENISEVSVFFCYLYVDPGGGTPPFACISLLFS